MPRRVAGPKHLTLHQEREIGTMAGRDGIFAGDDPFALIEAWLEEAGASEPNDPNAMQVATVDETGLPNVRTILLKEVERDGAGDGAFVFYTNYGSAKSHELEHMPKAALVFHWKSLRRQIRARGPVERVDGAQADEYYASRPLGSRLGAWASRQSEPLASRDVLVARVDEAREAHGEEPPRPPFWGGFRLRPVELEFWADGLYRLHDRFRWTREAPGASWAVDRLYP